MRDSNEIVAHLIKPSAYQLTTHDYLVSTKILAMIVALSILQLPQGHLKAQFEIVMRGLKLNVRISKHHRLPMPRTLSGNEMSPLRAIYDYDEKPLEFLPLVS